MITPSTALKSCVRDDDLVLRLVSTRGMHLENYVSERVSRLHIRRVNIKEEDRHKVELLLLWLLHLHNTLGYFIIMPISRVEKFRDDGFRPSVQLVGTEEW
jgi:hypothetical protein